MEQIKCLVQLHFKPNLPKDHKVQPLMWCVDAVLRTVQSKCSLNMAPKESPVGVTLYLDIFLFL